MESGGVSFLKMRSFRKSFFAVLSFFAVFAVLQQVALTNNASARDYNTCVNNANSKFSTNTNDNGEKKPYANISDVGPTDGEYGVKWACKGGNGSARAVVWLASDYHTEGYPDIIDVNTIVERTGTYTMYIVGSVVGLQAKWSSGDGSYMRINYATQVKLCADSDLNICWANAGINRTGSDWHHSDSDGWYFARAYESGNPNDDGAYDNWWTNPQSATITIDMDTFLSKASTVSHYDTYDLVTVYMFRKFGFTGQTGVTPIKLVVRKNQAATFNGSVTATITDMNNNASVSSTTNNPGASQTITVSGDSYKVKFVHEIERTDSGGESISNSWSTAISPTSRPRDNNALGAVDSGTVATSEKKKYTAKSYEYGGTIYPGQTITYCETLTYNSKKGEGVATENGSKTTCIIVRREPEATFTASVTATVTKSSNGASVSSTTNNPGDAQTLTIGDENYTVRFVHTINRTDSLGHTVSNSWDTTVSPSSKPNAANAVGAGANGSVSTANKTTYKVRDYTYTGKLYAGQTITYCETLNYDSFKATGKATQRGSKTVCVVVKRASSVCASLKGNLTGTIYSYNKGFNYGQIGVKNRNINDNYTYYGSYNTSGAIEIYARPGDEIKFEHNLCAGGVYARAVGAKETVSMSYQYSGASDSSTDPNVQSRYLFGEQVSGWNASTQTSTQKPMVYTNVNESNALSQVYGNTSVSPGENAYYNNCLTGGSTTKTNGFYKIAGGVNAITCDNRVKTLDTGHTITQSLTWMSLGYDNGVKSGGNDVTATASVKIPYNYILEPYAENTSTVAYLGEQVAMAPGVVVRPRVNAVFGAGSSAYATITKPTDVNVRYYYKSAGGAMIASYDVAERSKAGYRLNQSGALSGNGANENAMNTVENGGTRLGNVSIVIPDDGSVQIGDKVCVEVSVYPADSHDNRSASAVMGAGAGNEALIETSNGSNWATAVSCSTIAKKPTMSVESSNAYSATQFQTAYYVKTQNNQQNRYGSWSEYGVFGRIIKNDLFASGAGLGYSRAGYPQTHDANIVRADNSANNVATSSNSNDCTFMTQTFANASCETSSATIGGVSASQYEQRIKDQYMNSSGSFDIAGLATRNYGGVNYYDVSGYNGSDVIKESSGLVMFDSSKNLYVSALPDLTNEQFAAKNVEKRNRTIIYSAPGKSIVIDGNIGQDGGSKNSIDELTQVVIFAKNVYFTSNPTYVNAIIIADEVNTCKYVGSTKYAVGGQGMAETISSGTCYQPLRFDAPVVTKKVILNRTAGAGNGAESIVRAEIFNLNMANYLWSFNQMSRLGQATTVYMRELPTRY